MDSAGPSRREIETRRSATLMKRLLLGFKRMLDDELRPREVTSAQLRFLHELKERPGASGAQMARACYMTPQSAQALMAKAVAHGWVVRGKSAENDRLVTARLTPEGECLLEYADAVLARLEAEVWSGVKVAELRGMNDLMERALANLDGD
jgi:DNA-binding MarR family transcriptional regulator